MAVGPSASRLEASGSVATGTGTAGPALSGAMISVRVRTQPAAANTTDAATMCRRDQCECRTAWHFFPVLCTTPPSPPNAPDAARHESPPGVVGFGETRRSARIVPVRRARWRECPQSLERKSAVALLPAGAHRAPRHSRVLVLPLASRRVECRTRAYAAPRAKPASEVARNDTWSAIPARIPMSAPHPV